MKHSEETKKKISKKLKGKPAWNKGIKNPFSPEVLKKMSESQKKRTNWNYKLTPEKMERIYFEYETRQYYFPEEGTKAKNGKVLNYLTLFSKQVAKELGVTPQALRNRINNYERKIQSINS